ncbi:hypothetical protein [Chitinophaga varians]|uniref:hypothetical protein n=1 Tax=Chitinophaga varians TaxID=2202339 RepID=UPI00165F7E00|nr:hypothetical protein [Chitinophaga varians]MBC9913291.1 hypothetical protein [Chitinophaga varians]
MVTRLVDTCNSLPLVIRTRGARTRSITADYLSRSSLLSSIVCLPHTVTQLPAAYLNR